MSKTYVPRQLRTAVEREAEYRCGYCLTPQAISGAALEIEHIIAEVAGGLTVEDNLWLACTACNRYKGSRAMASTRQAVNVCRSSTRVSNAGASTSPGVKMQPRFMA